MIAELDLRASRHQLDRGLRLSLPYFDDRRLSLRYWSFTVIPKGRILFVPAFVVLAVEREIERVQAQREFTEPPAPIFSRVCASSPAPSAPAPPTTAAPSSP